MHSANYGRKARRHGGTEARRVGALRSPAVRATLVAMGVLISASALAQAPPVAPPDAVIELWDQQWTLSADGSIVYREKQHVRLNNERAHGEFADPRITYNANTDKLDILVARVKRPDGTYRELPDYSHVEVAPSQTSGWPAFAGIRQHLLVMSGIEPGCVVELEYQITTKAGTRPFLAGEVRLDHRYAVNERRAVITVPPDVKLRTAVTGVSGSLPPDSREIVLRDLPAAPDEPQALPWQTRCPRLIFSTAGGASTWLKQRTSELESAAEGSELITKLAAEWTKDKESAADKMRALQEKLAAGFNFVELPVEWRPSSIRPASEVIRTNYGLPEEAAAVLLALARTAKLPVCPGLLVNDDVWNYEAPQNGMVATYVVLLVPDRPGDLELTPGPDGIKPYYKALDTGEYPEIWDPHSGRVLRTARWAGYTLLPVPDVLMPRTLLPAWVNTDESRCNVQGKVTVNEDGSLAGTLTLRTTGLFVSSESLRSSDAQKSRIAALLGRVVPDINVESFTIKTLAPGEFEIAAQIKSSKPLKKLGETHCLQLAQDGPFLADVPLPLAYSHRGTPVRLAGAFDEDLAVTFDWPEKWHLAAQPGDLARVAGDWGGVEQSVTTEKHGLTLRRHTRIVQAELPAAAFMTVRDPLNELRSEQRANFAARPIGAVCDGDLFRREDHMSALWQSIAALLVSLGGFFCTAAAQDTPPAAASAPARAGNRYFRDALIIGSVGRGGPHRSAHGRRRSAARRWAVVPRRTRARSWSLPSGQERTWETAAVGEDGWIRSETLVGGYAYAAVECDRAQTMLLDASGHSVVYVNGQPRTGDPYQTGSVRLPVPLQAGTNQLLFVCGRGELRAKLVECLSPIVLDPADATLPDLIVGEKSNAWAGLIVRNATDQMLWNAVVTTRCGETQETTHLPPVPAWGVRKVACGIRGPAPTDSGSQDVTVALSQNKQEFDRVRIQLRIRLPHEPHKRTFLSAIDGSVQFYGVQPMQPDADPNRPPAMFLTLHGAGVDAAHQASCYAPKTWGHVVAPSNRRPYGFDWEDWGRIDALEVLAVAGKILGTDPLHTYLTGHSMGGHGTWQIGAHYPDRFAAIAPSAGWISFFTYAGGERPEPKSPVEEVLLRAATPIDTPLLKRNYLHFGIYILHGDLDDNVPVEQARKMRAELGKFHPNFAYYERSGAGHWWGNECMDWPPLFDFLRQNTRTPTREVRHIEFVTANPAISATCDWATIETQLQSLQLSTIDLQLDPNARIISGRTDNVARLTLALRPPESTPPPRGQTEGGGFILEAGQPLTIELDGDRLDNIAWPAVGNLLHLARTAGHWQLASADSSRSVGWAKSPLRAGPFKEAFQHSMQFVYGTHGTPEENAVAAAKARYDAEAFWYRGNGSVDVLSDTDFDPQAEPDRGVVLYGNFDTNGVWEELFQTSPVQVNSGVVRVGEREFKGDDLAVLAIYPRPGSTRALVAIVGGTGPAGLRLTERLPYFVSGVAYPDWIVLGADTLRDALGGVRAAGFYDANWQFDAAQSAFSSP